MCPKYLVTPRARSSSLLARVACTLTLISTSALAAWQNAGFPAVVLRDASTLSATETSPWFLQPFSAEGPRFASAPSSLFPEENDVLRVTTGFDWLRYVVNSGLRYQFADPQRFALLDLYTTPATERSRSSRWFFARTLSPEKTPLVPTLNWRIGGEQESRAEFAASLWGTIPEPLPVVRKPRCAPWARPRTIAISSTGSDYDRLALLDCAGEIAPFALDRISRIARAPGTPDPEIPLPDVPSESPEWKEEWVDGVRLLHPRLLWLVQQIGEAFPKHTIQIMSGYRREKRTNSMHRQGRALDLRVLGVDNEVVFDFCRKLKDVGCGYYPYHPFVHVDVRLAASKSVIWVDTSQPGEPSVYVDAWPPLVEAGAMAGANSD